MMKIPMDEPDRRIADAVDREGPRLRGYLRRRLPDRADVDDVLQDVFSELVEAYRLSRSIEHLGAWLFRVARSKVVDRFRSRRTEPLDAARPLHETSSADDDEGPSLQDLLPSPDAGPDAVYARGILLEQLADALDELPPEQKSVFLAHEVEGRTFRELAAETGIPLNTLLSRKRYAVLYLRGRLQAIYDDFRKG